MNKKVLVISSSFRPHSNSDAMADAFAKGASESGNQVEKINLRGKNIKFCMGCLSCLKTGRCVIKDDAEKIVCKIQSADVLAFATPIYYYEMAGQMKTLLDRCNPLFKFDYNFKDIYMLSCAAEDDEKTDDRAISGLQGWIECFEYAHFAGSVFADGVAKPGDIKDHPSLIKAYEMGKSI